MSDHPGVARRALSSAWRTVQWIRTGEADMQAVYGPNPNALTPAETIGSAALITVGLFVASGS